MAEGYDFVRSLLEGSFTIYGDEGNFFITKEALMVMDNHPDIVANELESKIIERSKALGKDFEFSVVEDIHPHLGEGFTVYWRPSA